MTYSITYSIDDLSSSDKKIIHTRYYHALNKSSALEMFKETCSHGSLKGYAPTIVKIKKISQS